MTGKIHSYESFATFDGEGVRFAVFMKGCNLRCVCCHNPDTWGGEGEILHAEELVKKILRYKPYFGSKGGVTVSGGEPLLQGAFLVELFTLLKKENINIVLDTSGSIIDEFTEKILKLTDTLILDVKQCSDEKYLKYAGCSLNDVLEFLKIADKNKVKTWIRTVIIPKINDDEESVKKIYELIKDFNCVYKYELLAFHTLGFSKYEKLKINNPLLGYKGLSEEKFKSLNDFLFKLKKGSNIL